MKRKKKAMMKRTWMSSFPLPDARGLGLIWFLLFYFSCSFVLSKFCSECELIDVSSTVFVLATHLSETCYGYNTLFESLIFERAERR